MMLGFYVARFTGLKGLEFRIPSLSGLGYQYVARCAGLFGCGYAALCNLRVLCGSNEAVQSANTRRQEAAIIPAP